MALPSTTTNNTNTTPQYHPVPRPQQPPLYHPRHVTPSSYTHAPPPPRGYPSSRSHPAPIPRPSYGNSPHNPAAVRLFGSGQQHPHPHPHPQPGQMMRPNNNTHLQHHFNTGPVYPMVRGVPLSNYHKSLPSPAPAPDGNGYKDLRSKDDSFVIVRDRKVRVSGSSSLYAACRSWLRNGIFEETQPHYLDGIKLLPKPSPPPVPDAHSPAEQEPNKEEEEEESVEHLSPKDLLKRHVKRAKKVRARLREERLRRIARYKTRLALLLPPLVEQQHQFRNESAAGN